MGRKKLDYSVDNLYTLGQEDLTRYYKQARHNLLRDLPNSEKEVVPEFIKQPSVSDVRELVELRRFYKTGESTFVEEAKEQQYYPKQGELMLNNLITTAQKNLHIFYSKTGVPYSNPLDTNKMVVLLLNDISNAMASLGAEAVYANIEFADDLDIEELVKVVGGYSEADAIYALDVAHSIIWGNNSSTFNAREYGNVQDESMDFEID